MRLRQMFWVAEVPATSPRGHQGGAYARKQLARRMGRNSAFDHAGNVGIAAVAAAVGYAFSQRAVFLLVPIFAGLASIAVLSIPAKAINFNRARDLDRERDAAATTPKPADYGILFKSWPLVVFGLCVMLFHLANAALLPLGQFVKFCRSSARSCNLANAARSPACAATPDTATPATPDTAAPDTATTAATAATNPG
jgi:hypothetical protein